MTDKEIREIKEEIERLKDQALDMALNKELRAVQRNHARLVKLQKILKENEHGN